MILRVCVIAYVHSILSTGGLSVFVSVPKDSEKRTIKTLMMSLRTM